MATPAPNVVHPTWTSDSWMSHWRSVSGFIHCFHTFICLWIIDYLHWLSVVFSISPDGVENRSKLNSGLMFFFSPPPPESEPVADVLREDPRPALLHGGAVGRGHEDLDGRDRDGGGGIHTVHELRLRPTSGSISAGTRTDSVWPFLFPVSMTTPCFWLNVTVWFECVNVSSPPRFLRDSVWI